MPIVTPTMVGAAPLRMPSIRRFHHALSLASRTGRSLGNKK